MTIQFKNELTERHLALAENIKANMTRKGNSFKEIKKNAAFYGNLPEELTQKQYDATLNYQEDYLTSATVAALDMAATAFDEDKELRKVSSRFALGRGHVDIDVTEQRTYPVKDSEPVTKHLVTVHKYKSAVGSNLDKLQKSCAEQYVAARNK